MKHSFYIFLLTGLAEWSCPSIGNVSCVTIRETSKTLQLIMEKATERGVSNNYPLRGEKTYIPQGVLPVL